jgi:hypothetical protein
MIRIHSLFVALFLTSSFAVAQPGEPPFDNQLVSISCDAGSSVTIGWTDANGSPDQATRFDTNNNGEVEFAIPDTITEISVTKLSDGQILQYTKKLRRSNVALVGGTVLLR